MPEPSPTLYDIKKTTVWFAVASILLLISLVAMIVQDSNRDWKNWQRKFMAYSREQAQADLEKAKQAFDKTAHEKLQSDLAAARDSVKARQSEIKQAKKEFSKLDLEFTKTNSRYQDLKQFQDSDRYFLEEYTTQGHAEKAKPYAEKVAKRALEIQQAKLALEKIQLFQEEKKAVLNVLTAAAVDTEKAIQALQKDRTRLEMKVKNLAPSWEKEILNAPMLDFLNPTLRIQQVVLENLEDDFFFLRVKKVDRCTTCHLAIDQKGFEEAPQPFRTHPNLDLFLGDNSAHPLESIGCTVCHGGSGHSANFVTAAHTPRDEVQAAQWKKKYRWEPMQYWEDKMLPSPHIEASCAKCHQGVVDVPQAPKLNEGRHMAQTYGCFACHKVVGFENSWEVGPSLQHVQSKLEEDWIIRWLQNPKEFRASTKMPQIFHLSNTSDPESTEKNYAAIAGIAAYLMKNSDPIVLTPPPVPGNPEEGKRLVQGIGCLGCHTVGDQAANAHGPELSGLGSKVRPEWLYTWLKDPKGYYADSRMPNLRLTDEETSHIVSFLLSDHNEKFDSIRLPRVKPEVVDTMALDFMTGNMRHEDAQKKLTLMNPKERLEYLGERMINRQGCFGCHDIKGFEHAKRVGTELTTEGSKDVHKLDFGLVHLEHTRYAWFAQKLKDPRIFDEGKVKTYDDKLRMPQFDFTEEQIQKLVTFILSLQKSEIPLVMQKRLDLREQEIEAGRLLVSKMNCQGCHTLDGKEGAVRSLMMDDLGIAPPVLNGEGKKVQEQWLYHFLENPTTIRPWLRYRMPTFSFTSEELTALVQYFNHLSAIKPAFTANEIPPAHEEQLAAGRELFKAFQCIKCHQAEPPKGLSASFLAPNLNMVRQRLRPDWIVEWLRDPQVLQEGTMMPTFFVDGQSPMASVLEGDVEKQIAALRDYIMIFTQEEAARLGQAAPAPPPPAQAAQG